MKKHEPKYIEVEGIMRACYDSFLKTGNKAYSEIIALADAVPAADVAEVVRCKDCKWFGDIGCAIRIVDDSDSPSENDFCSFAERKTMDDTISRQAAIDAILHNQEVYSNNFGDEPIDKYTIAIIDNDAQTIAHLPSAERHGRWLKGDEMADYPRIPYKAWETYCSCCGEIMEQSHDNFCGNCGAKMDEVEE